MKYLTFIVLLLGTAILILYFGFSLPTEIALSVLILAITFDFYTTWRCLKKRGKEGNPVMALMFRKIGVGRTFGLMVGIWVCFIMFRWLPQLEGIQTAVALAYWIIPLNNLIVLRRLNRRNTAQAQ